MIDALVTDLLEIYYLTLLIRYIHVLAGILEGCGGLEPIQLTKAEYRYGQVAIS